MLYNSNYMELKNRWKLSSDTHQKAIFWNDSENLLERNIPELPNAQIKVFILMAAKHVGSQVKIPLSYIVKICEHQSIAQFNEKRKSFGFPLSILLQMIYDTDFLMCKTILYTDIIRNKQHREMPK